MELWLGAAVVAFLLASGLCQDETTAATTTPTGGTDTTAANGATTAAASDGDSTPTAGATGEDERDECCFWASIDECKKNPLYMRPFCQKSCGTSGATIYTAKTLKDNIPSECKPTPETDGSGTGTGGGIDLKALAELLKQLVGDKGGNGKNGKGKNGHGKHSHGKNGHGKNGNGKNGKHRNGGNGGGCKDSKPKCKKWATDGECDKNPYWMKVNCQKSCNSCGTTVKDADKKCSEGSGSCKNKHKHCCFWKSKNECTKNKKFMDKNCKAACGGC